MSKPFKSQFDLMAEAYGNIKYNKQAIINEYSATRKVRGYEPQVIGESHKHGAVEEHYPEDKDTRTAGEALNDARMDREGEDEARERLNATNPAEDAEGMENKYTVIENDEEGSIQPMEYRQPEGDLIKTVKSDGIVKKCYQHPEGREWTVESDKVIDFDKEGSWTWDEESNVEDAEEAGFNHKQLDELEDIVHAILDKRDHEDRASKHEDGEY